MEQNFDLSGRLAVVTGASGQLGQQFCRVLAAHGANVAGLDLRVEASRVAAYGEELAARIKLFSADVTSKDSLRSAFAKIQESFGTAPHILINNAGIDSPPGSQSDDTAPFEDYPEATWDRVMAVNLKGPFLVCQVFGSEMARAGRGSIINVASIYGAVAPDNRIYGYHDTPFFKPVAYSASKAGLVQLTRYLAAHWGPRNVRVNAVSFAGVFNDQDPRFLEGYLPKVPLGRMAAPGEYNGTILWLASEASSYATGSNFFIDGGYTAL